VALPGLSISIEAEVFVTLCKEAKEYLRKMWFSVKLINLFLDKVSICVILV